MKPYEPKPLDTAGTSLGKSVEPLTELLARHLHDVWARGRLAEGWRYGLERDDVTKKHPCLVPYEDLPESEKVYDRNAALETIRALLALGYRLDPPAMHPVGSGGAIEDTYARARQFLAEGEPLLAYDVLVNAGDPAADGPGRQQLIALALLRSGAPERALVTLENLAHAGHRDEETLGLLARVRKEIWLRSSTPEMRSRNLRLARDAYLDAYRATGGYWTGTNAATLTVLLGDRDTAVGLAERVRHGCLETLSRTPAGDAERYWILASLGETALVLGNWAEAEQRYGEAGMAGGGRWADLSSTRRNARRLLSHLGRDADWIARVLVIPRIAVFSGHRVDTSRFPRSLEALVHAAIRERVSRLGIGFGYASATCGGDLLFLEAILAAGGEAHVVLPYDAPQFRADCVDAVPGNWGERFTRVLDQASEVITASPHRADGGIVDEYVNKMLVGMAGIRADQLDAPVVPLALWDGLPGGAGGVASAVETWRGLGHEVEVIDVPGGRPDPAELAKPPTAERFEPHIMTLLFADAVNFSKLTEDQTRGFVEHFLGRIAALATETPPVVRNTWGDGLYLVFGSVREAGLYALALRDSINATNWEAVGLPGDLNLRIGLHAGPVYRCRDPVTGLETYVGTHVSRAARIEPITPPGEVYASRGFAALARAEGVKDFGCEYVGLTRLAKAYGTFPTYHVRRAGRV